MYEEKLGEENTQEGKYLTFKLGDETYGLDIKDVTEIISLQEINTIPEVPDYVKGIINLRGKVIPVIDVRLKFKKLPVGYDERTCIIIVNIEDAVAIGLIVDNVDEVTTIDEENITPPPSNKTGFENRYIKGIGRANNKVQLLLECRRLLNVEEMNDVANIA